MLVHDGEKYSKKGAEGVQDSSQGKRHVNQVPELN